jgi:hypothetical protein
MRRKKGFRLFGSRSGNARVRRPAAAVGGIANDCIDSLMDVPETVTNERSETCGAGEGAATFGNDAEVGSEPAEVGAEPAEVGAELAEVGAELAELDAARNETPSDNALDDVTMVTGKIDARMAELDPDGALRSAIIRVGASWRKTSQDGLLSKPTTRTLDKAAQTTDTKRAMDLLDALTRSGALQIEEATLHVVVAATHCFDRNLMDTIVCDNVNPIERVERSTLILAGVVHGVPTASLVKANELDRVRAFSAPWA